MDKNNIYNTTEALPVPPKPTQYQVIEVLNRANEVIYRLREENTEEQIRKYIQNQKRK